MMADLDPETQRLVEAAVDAAPALTSDQITELRRVLKPEARLRVLPQRTTPVVQQRRAA
ncbi:hypothetical protein AB0F72_09485 [Actinoplanes sp. NPDC023936]|uniref:hypothetical protein n=1 Tax=Actinoplanes sp. NPDC023936 TaxID=3154910 RepID=UPI0033CD2B1D